MLRHCARQLYVASYILSKLRPLCGGASPLVRYARWRRQRPPLSTPTCHPWVGTPRCKWGAAAAEWAGDSVVRHGSASPACKAG
eukprot:3215722-Pleurochrysis_carterae.AAC.1